METTKVNPCPFCGGDGLPCSVSDGCSAGEPDAYAYYYCCRSCAATGGWAKSWGGAQRNWNTRWKETMKESDCNKWSNDSFTIYQLTDDEIAIEGPYNQRCKIDGGDFEYILAGLCAAYGKGVAFGKRKDYEESIKMAHTVS